MKKLLILVALAAIAGVGYMLYTTYYSVSDNDLKVEEKSVDDLDFLLDDAVNKEIDSALNEALLLNTLDVQELADEAAEIDSLSEFDAPVEIDQYLSEASQ